MYFSANVKTWTGKAASMCPKTILAEVWELINLKKPYSRLGFFPHTTSENQNNPPRPILQKLWILLSFSVHTDKVFPFSEDDIIGCYAASSTSYFSLVWLRCYRLPVGFGSDLYFYWPELATLKIWGYFREKCSFFPLSVFSKSMGTPLSFFFSRFIKPTTRRSVLFLIRIEVNVCFREIDRNYSITCEENCNVYKWGSESLRIKINQIYNNFVTPSINLVAIWTIRLFWTSNGPSVQCRALLLR